MIDRYTTPEMKAIWNLENRTQKWLDVEIAVCEGLASFGYIPKDAVDEIKSKAVFSLDRMAELEKITRHDVMAFVRNVSENVGPAGRYIHFGITSYDVVDTALGLLMSESVDMVINRAETLAATIGKRAREEAQTPMIGRTHGVHAEPITFGFKLAGWYAEIKRSIERLKATRDMVAVGKISGAVGTHANIDPRIETFVCEKLKLKVDPATTQIICRDRHAQLLSNLAILAGSMERWSTEVRNLQRTEILEVQEAFAEGQTGSSAMPHKRNPWNCETITGLARVVRGNLMPMLESICTWHERDLANSSMERIIIPDSFLLVDWMLVKFNNIVSNLKINRDQMQKNLEMMGGLVYSEQIMMMLISKGLSREDAYKMAQRNAAVAWESKDYKTALQNDADVTAVLTQKELDDAFTLEHHLKNVEYTLTQLGL